MMNRKSNHPFKSGYVAIVGKPNVGKSTLLNHFLKQKLAIVTPKPQTTRNRILGILNGNHYQVILLDTPGLIEPKYKLQESMVRTAMSTIKEADLILMMIEAQALSEADETVLRSLESSPVHKILVINKVDTIRKEELLPLMDEVKDRKVFREIIPISALKGDGLEDLLNEILKILPQGDPFYPPDIISDEPERFFVAEIIREKIFLCYGEEIPYATAVTIAEFKERSGQKDYIHAKIYVERESQKGILIGKGGKALKRVGQRAREEIETFLGRSVYLQLEVAVKKKWRKDPNLMKSLGFS
jgi:GTP-binding protein Era